MVLVLLLSLTLFFTSLFIPCYFLCLTQKTSPFFHAPIYFAFGDALYPFTCPKGIGDHPYALFSYLSKLRFPMPKGHANRFPMPIRTLRLRFPVTFSHASGSLRYPYALTPKGYVPRALYPEGVWA